MKENSTIVVPIQFHSKKGWKGFQKHVFRRLESGIREEGLKWKKLAYPVNGELKENERDEFITDEAAFEMDVNKMRNEEEYFYDEAFRAIYDTKYASSCFFVLTESGKENEVLLGAEETKKGEQAGAKQGKQVRRLQLFFGETKRTVRKMYLYLTNMHSGMLVVELDEVEQDEKENALANEIDAIVNEQPEIGRNRKSAKELIPWALGNAWKEKEYELPFKKKCFLATLLLNNAMKEECMNGCELKKENVEIRPFIMRGKGKGVEALESFFGHYFQIYLLCILQKTEVVHMSYRTGEASRKKQIFFMKGNIEAANREYVLFYNQYDMVECTYDADGSAIYNRLRKELLIDRGCADIREQMNALREYATLVSGRMTNILLTILSIIGFVLSVIEFVAKIKGGMW